MGCCAMIGGRAPPAGAVPSLSTWQRQIQNGHGALGFTLLSAVARQYTTRLKEVVRQYPSRTVPALDRCSERDPCEQCSKALDQLVNL